MSHYSDNMTLLLKTLTDEEKTHTKTMVFYIDSIKYAFKNQKITDRQYFTLIKSFNCILRENKKQEYIKQ